MELGLQTIHERTAAFIRRGYPLSVFEQAVKQLTQIDVQVIVHTILGLPFESKNDMIDTIQYLAQFSASRQQEKKEKAVRLSEELKAAREEYECLEEALAYLDTIFSVGTGISHKKYGNGTIIARNGSTVEVEFEDGTKKKLGLTVSAANGIITSHMENYDEMPGSYREVIKKEAAIRNAVSYAEKNFSMYAEYLE